MASWARSHIWVIGCAVYAVFMIPIWVMYQFGGDKWFSYIDIISIVGALSIVFAQEFFGLPKEKEEL
jgi:hypothetical protein